jgi:hypothetical protein
MYRIPKVPRGSEGIDMTPIFQGSIAEVVGVQRRPSPDRGQSLAEKIKILARQINDEDR